MKLPHWSLLTALILALPLTGCSQLRGRHHAREGNRLYLDGNYKAALDEYETAERFVPDLKPVVLNKGLACRQLMTAGAKSPENERAVSCALDAFKHLKEIAPNDPRGDQLYVQTLFDADRYDELAQRYRQQLQKNPNNLAAINGLIQVYSRSDKWDESLKWIMKRADMQPKDAEAQYGVGVLIWNRLFQKGGNGDKAAYDPRAEPKQPPPPFGEGDIVGEQRIQLADRGIEYLKRALAIRPTYREAMTYLNLLLRQKAIAFFDRPDDWKALADQAEEWRKKSMQTEGH